MLALRTVLSCPAFSHLTSHYPTLLLITSPSLTSPSPVLSCLVPHHTFAVFCFAGVRRACPAYQSRVLERVPSPALYPGTEHTEHTAGHRNLLEGVKHTPFLPFLLSGVHSDNFYFTIILAAVVVAVIVAVAVAASASAKSDLRTRVRHCSYVYYMS